MKQVYLDEWYDKPDGTYKSDLRKIIDKNIHLFDNLIEYTIHSSSPPTDVLIIKKDNHRIRFSFRLVYDENENMIPYDIQKIDHTK